MSWRLWIGLATLLANTVAVASDNIALGDWSGSLDLAYEAGRQDTRNERSADSSFDSDLFRETLKLVNRGSYLFDPRLGTANFGLALGLFQENDQFTGTPGEQDGRLIGYNFDTTVLPQKPLSLLFLANQDQDIVNRNFGTRSEIQANRYGAHMNLREDSWLYDKGIPYFSSTLNVERLRLKETTSGQGQFFQRDEDRKLLNLTAHKGFEVADLKFRASYEDVIDTLRTDGAYTNRSARLDYSQDFGERLNRRWDSGISYYDRSGADATNSFIVNENIRLDHYDTLYSNYRYVLNRFETRNGLNQKQALSARVHHKLYNQLFSNFRVRVQKDNIPSGTREAYSTSVDSNYRRNLAHDGSLVVDVLGSAQINDNDLDSSLVEVVDEPHRAPDDLGAGNGFFLNNVFVVVSSIVIVDTRGGSRLPTELGVDYEVFPEGDRVQIIPIATSLIIQPGDPLLVSYDYTVAPAIKFSTVSWAAGGRIDYGWIAFSVRRDKSDQQLLSGRDDGFLNDRLNDDAELTLRGDWSALRASSSFGFEREESTRLQFRRWKFRQLASLARIKGLRLSFTATQSLTDFSLPIDRRRENYTARLAVDGFFLDAWSINAFTGMRLLIDSEIANEDVREAGIRIRRQFAKLTVSGSTGWSRFERGDVTTTDLRFQALLSRRF